MRIVWLNPFHSGSHAAVANGYTRYGSHETQVLSLSIDGGWRWRMRGSALTLARMCREQAISADLIVATSMLDLATFRALTRDLFPPDQPFALYMHENQITYPLPKDRQRDVGLAWLSITAALTADRIFFNSDFHRRDFLSGMQALLRRYHDHRELASVDDIAARSEVLPPGIELAALDAVCTTAKLRNHPPVILWNGRWEYDKQPEVFFAALEEVARRGYDFRLIIAGEHVDPDYPPFRAARERWQRQIVHWGFVPDADAYRRLLWQADIVVSTALHENFGIGVVEALACGCVPVLPQRQNYPDLLPTNYHANCLYAQDESLPDRICATLNDLDRLRTIDWRAIAAPYGWHVLGPQYDVCFQAIALTTKRLPSL